MKTRMLVGLLCGLVAAGAALAETLVVDDQVTLRESGVDRPKRGSTMADVEKRSAHLLRNIPPWASPPLPGGTTPGLPFSSRATG